MVEKGKTIEREYEQIKQTILDETAVSGIGKGIDHDDMIEGQKPSNVTIYVKEDSSRINDLITPIANESEAIVTVKEKDSEPTPHSCNTSVYDPVPGGVDLINVDEGGGGTATHKVLVNGSPHLLTCAHAHYDHEDDCDNNVGGVVSQGASWATLGEADSGLIDKSLDIVTIPESGSQRDYGDHIRNGDQPNISGHITEIAVNDLKPHEIDVYQLGVTTCETSGKILNDKREGFEWCAINDPYIFTTTHAESGDSGGPHYYKGSGYDGPHVATLGTHFGNIDDGILASPAWLANERHGIVYDV